MVWFGNLIIEKKKKKKKKEFHLIFSTFYLLSSSLCDSQASCNASQNLPKLLFVSMETPLLDLSSRNAFFTPKNYSLYYTKPSKLTNLSLCCPDKPTTSHRRFCADESPPPILEDTDVVLDLVTEKTPNRRRIVRLAWEKLVRWSRSWRFKAKTDVLERTNKVGFNPLLFFFLILSFFSLLKMWVDLLED